VAEVRAPLESTRGFRGRTFAVAVDPTADSTGRATVGAVSEVRAADATPASRDPSDVDAPSDGDDTEPRGRAGARWAGLLAVGLPSAVLGLHSASYGQWIVDDAGITFAYARSLATGAGPVLQPGAPAVEGYSDPAWLALLVGAHRLGLFDHGTWFGVPDLVALPKVLGWLCGVGVFLCFLAAARAVSSRPLLIATVAGVLTAAIPSFAIWTTSGLENGLLALAVVAIATVMVRAVAAGRLHEPTVAATCGALAALAALTRPEGIVYAVAYPVVLLLLRPTGAPLPLRAVVTSLVTAAVPVAAHLVWRVVAFGDLVANPARAKEQGLPTLDSLAHPAVLVTYLGWSACALALVLVAAAWARRPQVGPALVALTVPLGLALVAFAVLVPDWMEQARFATPIWPLGAFATTVAGAALWGGATRRHRRLLAAVTAPVLLLSVHGWSDRAAQFRAEPTVTVCAIALNTGLTINTYADVLGVRHGSVLAVDAGGTALTSRLRFVDLAGLADRTIARHWQDDDMAGLRDHVFERVRPTFVRLWTGWAELKRSGLLADPRMARDYVLLGGPSSGGGTWVRRDVVTTPAGRSRLVQATRRAPRIAAGIDALYADPVQRWWCGPTMRPSPVGADPLRVPPRR
jgi:hypothetical protein